MTLALSPSRLRPVGNGASIPAILAGLPPIEPNGGDRYPMDEQPPAAPQDPFLWGAGGKRMTPAEIAIARELAGRQMATGMDYSPVQSWAQGAARLAQGIVGGLGERNARRAADANTAESASIAKILAQGMPAGGDSRAYDATLISAATDPYADPVVRNLAGAQRTRIEDQRARRAELEWKASQPDYFMSGDDRVRYDPTTGKSTVVYDAPEAFDSYAKSLGLQPGTPEYQTALKDYVLRGNGPTAFGYDAQLDNVRTNNRSRLKAQPTYRQANPVPRASGGGGGAPPRTLAGVVAPILAKISKGQPLTASEQAAWNAYRPAGGRSRGGAAAGGGGANIVVNPTTGERKRWDGKQWATIK